jgi:predicted nucleic acid-binding protein
VIIVDAGPIVAMINSRDEHHRWARNVIGRLSEPMITCDAVLSEALFLVSHSANGVRRFSDILVSGAIHSDFVTNANSRELATLIEKYRSLPMSFADACLVRLSEIHEGSTILTIDSHFQIYRKDGEGIISVLMPD